MERVEVAVCATDPVSRAGLLSCLRARPELLVATDAATAEVVVAAFEALDDAAVSALRAANPASVPVVLVADELGESDLVAAVDHRVGAVVSRDAATDERLPQAIDAVLSGGSDLRATVLGRLLGHAERLREEARVPADREPSDEHALSRREIDVLRLMSEGLDTNEIARELRYSDRTVKNIVYSLTTRLRLRNRSHAVAYAMRAGII